MACAQIDAVIAVSLDPSCCLRQLQTGRIGEWRDGVGHREDHRETARQRRRRATSEVFFMRRTGFAQVNMRVDQTGKKRNAQGWFSKSSRLHPFREKSVRADSGSRQKKRAEWLWVNKRESARLEAQASWRAFKGDVILNLSGINILANFMLIKFFVNIRFP